MGFFSVLSIFAIFAVVLSSPLNSNDFKSERELRRDIFRDYDKLVRPVKKATTAVPVQIGFSPLSILSMNEKDQILNLDAWIKMSWTDEYLRWDPSEYDNITELHVSATEIWKPDISLYTASPVKSLFPFVQTNVIIYNNGMIMWVPPFLVSSRCPIPFRSHVSASKTFVECNIKMGSWTYSGKMLDLQLFPEKVDLTNFLDYNHEWKLVKVDSNRESKKYPCCVDEYPSVNFNITLKKRSYYLNGN